MRIESVEARLYRVPPTVRISDAIQSIHRWEWIVTTVRTEGGLVGLEGGSLSDLGLLEEPWQVTGGWGVPPRRPGHGFLWNASALKRYEVTGKPADVVPTRTG